MVRGNVQVRGNVHTADLGYLGFQDYHKKISSL